MEFSVTEQGIIQMHHRENIKKRRREFHQAKKAVESVDLPAGTVVHNRLQSVVTTWAFGILPFIQDQFENHPEAARVWQVDEYDGHTLDELAGTKFQAITVNDRSVDPDALIRAGEAMEQFFIRYIDIPEQPPVVDSHTPLDERMTDDEITAELEEYGFTEVDQ